jgi:hypothetical protein
VSDLRAITVKQPWAWAIAHGGKNIENRSRNLTYRGRLAIHAGKAWAWQGGQDRHVKQAFAPNQPAHAAGDDITPAQYPGRFATGAVIAVADLVDVHQGVGCCRPWGQVRNLGAATSHAAIYHLVLENVRPLAEPIACPGALGLWRLPQDVAEQISALPTA